MIHRLLIAGLSGVFIVSAGAAVAAPKDNPQVAAAGAGGRVQIPAVKSYNVPEKYRPQTVSFSGYKPGTIVIDPKNYFLYLIETPTTARRYGIAVGKIGLQFKGTANIRFKREWPRWIPTKDMVKRSPEHYSKFANGMDGGPGNPLGARALYLWQGNKDTYIRIHGTVQPWTIGSSASNGCFRMINDDVLDLYDRVDLGTEVVVL
ncbi:L,D-transpeptidase [Bartonella sp. LJL80]